MIDMNKLCFFAIAVLLAAGCSKEAGLTELDQTELVHTEEIRVGDGLGRLDININQPDAFSLSKSVLDLDYINTCYILIGPYTNGVHGKPIACIQARRKFTLVGLEEGRYFLAIFVNPLEEPQGIPTLEEFNGGIWYFKDFTGPKAGIAYTEVIRDKTVWVDLFAKRCYGEIYISNLHESVEALMTPYGHRQVFLDEVYLQNIPAFSKGYLWGWESGMPSASSVSQDNWFNPSETVGTCSNDFVNSLTSVKTDNIYNHSFTTVTFCLPPNTTSRKSRLVIRGHYSIDEKSLSVKDCYYTIELPDIKPNTLVKFKNIEIKGIGGESPDDYQGQSNVKYTMIVDNWSSGATIEEQY